MILGGLFIIIYCDVMQSRGDFLWLLDCLPLGGALEGEGEGQDEAHDEDSQDSQHEALGFPAFFLEEDL